MLICLASLHCGVVQIVVMDCELLALGTMKQCWMYFHCLWMMHVPLLVVSYSCSDLTLFVPSTKIKLKSWVMFHAPSVSGEDGREGGLGVSGSGSKTLIAVFSCKRTRVLCAVAEVVLCTQRNDEVVQAYVSAWTSGVLDTAAAQKSLSFKLPLHHIAGFLFGESGVVRDSPSINKVAKTLVRSSMRKSQQQVNNLLQTPVMKAILFQYYLCIIK